MPSPTTEVALEGAIEGSTYTVQLAASNTIGLGPVLTTTIGK